MMIFLARKGHGEHGFVIDEEYLFHKLEKIDREVVTTNANLKAYHLRLAKAENDVISIWKQIGKMQELKETRTVDTEGQECYVLGRKDLFKLGGGVIGGGSILLIVLQIILRIIENMYLG